MKRLLPILVLVCAAAAHAGEGPQNAAPSASTKTPEEAAIPVDLENARKAKALIDQAIQTLKRTLDPKNILNPGKVV